MSVVVLHGATALTVIVIDLPAPNPTVRTCTRLPACVTVPLEALAPVMVSSGGTVRLIEPSEMFDVFLIATENARLVPAITGVGVTFIVNVLATYPPARAGSEPAAMRTSERAMPAKVARRFRVVERAIRGASLCRRATPTTVGEARVLRMGRKT